jgi:putative drug exporter of the RND superfamily
VFVAGPLALQWDVIRILNAWLLPILGFVLVMSVVALAVAFRSVIVASVTTLMTLLSVTATIGVLVLVIQKGVGASLLGSTHASIASAWVPLVLFSVLFGLSMDYHVFLVSRIQERYSMTGEATGSIVFRVRAAGRIICAAAVIMGVVFAAFAGRLVFLQQLGLAVAVLIDAMLVRLTLVPAIMTRLGDHNWYASAWDRWFGRARGVARSDSAGPIESIARRE